MTVFFMDPIIQLYLYNRVNDITTVSRKYYQEIFYDSSLFEIRILNKLDHLRK